MRVPKVQRRGAAALVATAGIPLLAAVVVPAIAGAAIVNGVCQTTAFAVSTDGLVTSIDVPTGVVSGAPIDLGDGTYLSSIAITADGSTLLIVKQSTASLVKVDVATRAVTGTADVGQGPQNVAVTPDGSTALVTNATDQSVTTVDVATMVPDPVDIPVGAQPGGIAVTPDGSTAYVANAGSDSVSTIDIATRVKDPVDIAVGPFPASIAFTPDGSTAVVTNRMNDDTPVPDPTKSGIVSTIDVATRTKGPVDISGFQMPMGIAITPDGATAWVSNVGAQSISSIDIASRTKDPTDLTVGNEPVDLAITGDAKQLYVTNSGGHTASPVDLTTRTARAADQVSVGINPSGPVFTPCAAAPPVTTTTTSPSSTTSTTSTTVPAAVAVVVVTDPRFTG
jgi:YVTN family beta-propeller protein